MRSDVEVLTSSFYGNLGGDPVISMYGYPGFYEIVTYGDPGDDSSSLHFQMNSVLAIYEASIYGHCQI